MMKFIVLLVLILSISDIFAKYHSTKFLSKIRKHRAHSRHHLKSHLRHRARLTVRQDDPVEATEAPVDSNRYPNTDISDFSNPELDTWIKPFEWRSALIEDPLPAEKCVTPNAKKGTGGADSNAKVMKHLELRKTRISDGYAAYFFDQTDKFLLGQFEADVKESFKAFWSLNSETHKVASEGENLELGKVDTQALNEGVKNFKWLTHNSGEHIIKAYDLESEEYKEEESTLDLQEFVYMNIFENIKSRASANCEHCFKATKTIIREFYDYLDCNHDNVISAENIYWGMSNMKDLPYEKTTTTMVNDFVLNTMDFHSAGLDNFDFQYGLLTGMYERVISENGLSEIQLNSMKIGRRGVIDGGSGPAFRRRKLL